MGTTSALLILELMTIMLLSDQASQYFLAILQGVPMSSCMNHLSVDLAYNSERSTCQIDSAYRYELRVVSMVASATVRLNLGTTFLEIMRNAYGDGKGEQPC